ncbi:glutathione S-transferase [Psychromonas antarctica]|jgi:glutathione S-transferase|uniref:glutathione S-transferase n=1 Tax=Psychromonas antarctica TaxID=67573 RepID=UPI001EE8C28F|nr:glutathione S-transferase [Psychromonas antarctica]MCG6200953.1 glutathione S-transferase [Psychromonas antarctica]
MNHLFYSFRRCPYAMRARLAIAYSQQLVELREISLKAKPQTMLAVSAKGTVPVLQLADGTVLDESLDIMAWALEGSDPDGWLQGNLSEMLSLIDENDFEFKGWLDKYKYADRYPEHSPLYYRDNAEEFLTQLEHQLRNNAYLFGDRISLADMAILPFIRQFSAVDKAWFSQAPYPRIKIWLANFIDSTLFQSIMKEYPTWLESKQQITFPEAQ